MNWHWPPWKKGNEEKTLDELLVQKKPNPQAVLRAWQSQEAGKWTDDELKACTMGHRWPRSLMHPYCPICRMPMKKTL